MRDILQFTMFASISLQTAHKYYRDQKYTSQPMTKKSVVSVITNHMLEYFHGTKDIFFLLPYQFTFFLDFDQATDQLFLSSCYQF